MMSSCKKKKKSIQKREYGGLKEEGVSGVNWSRMNNSQTKKLGRLSRKQLSHSAKACQKRWNHFQQQKPKKPDQFPKSFSSQPWTVTYLHLIPETFSGNEQQPSEIISNGLESKKGLPPKMCRNITEICTAFIMSVLTGMALFWVILLLCRCLTHKGRPQKSIWTLLT